MIICIAELLRKIFTTEAMRIPISPINMKFPTPVRSFFVVYPKILSAPNMSAQMKKVDAMVAWAYSSKIMEKVTPFKVA